jgi:multidrug resistance protein, MATE family
LSDFKILSAHAGTVLVGQLAVMAFGITDTIVAGRYSDASLAALSVASAIYVSVFVALMGTLQALLPVWAELHGAGKASEVGPSFRQALYLCGLTIAVGGSILLSPGAVLRWTDVPTALRDDAERYLAVLALALAPALLFRMYSTLNQSLGKPLLVTGLQLGALLIKIPLSVWFVFGGWGLQPQGVVGCAWATLVVNYSLFGVAAWMLRTHSLYKPFKIWQALEAPRWAQIAGFARLGLPGGLGIMVEVTSFTLMALLIARMGVVSSAAHQIASNLAAVMYMVPLSISIAASSRVSYWRGAGDDAKSLAAIRLGFRMVIVTSLILSATLFLTREWLAPLYSSNPAVIAIVVPLLGWVLVFHLFDGLQALCVFVLRCFRVTVAPLVVYTLLLWGAGLGGGYLLAYHGLGPWAAQGSASAFWISSTLALGSASGVLLMILRRVVKRELQPNQRAQASRFHAPGGPEK